MLLTPDQEMIRDAVREFAQTELWPHAPEWDKTHHFPAAELKGLAELLDRVSVPVHVNTHEAQWVSRVTGIPMSDLTTHVHGDVVDVGDVGDRRIEGVGTSESQWWAQPTLHRLPALDAARPGPGAGADSPGRPHRRHRRPAQCRQEPPLQPAGAEAHLHRA